MSFRYIDIHTHVNLAAFKDDYAEVISRAHEAGVAMINVGTQADTAQRAVEIAQEYESGVYATIGLHPVHTSKSYHDPQEFTDVEKGFTSRGEQFDPGFYRELAQDPKVVGIGECGLDYFRTEEGSVEKQKAAFIEQIELANELKKPLMLHIRRGEAKNAYTDAYEILKAHAKVPGNLHFFVGSYEDAKPFWGMGYSTSFTGVVTFTHQYDEVVKAAPEDLIHAETDAPYATPVPHRGKRCEPHHVILIVQKLAELRGEDHEAFAEQLLTNARRLFGVSI